MRVTPWLRQTCVWEPKIGNQDKWGNWTYGAPQTIPCRKTTKKKQVNNKGERTYVDVSIFMTEVQISLGDKLDGEEIMASKNEVDFSGKVVFWESNPRPPLGFTP